MDLAAGAVDPPPGSGSGVHDGGGGDSGQRLGRRDEPLWIAAATAHPSEGSRGSGPHAAGSGLPGPNLAGKLQGRRPRLHDNGGGGATARQLRLDGVGVDGAGCGVVSGRLDGSGGAGTLGPDSTGRPASGVAEAAWVSALAEVTGAMAVLSLAGLEVGRWRGVGQVWRKPCAAGVRWWIRIERRTTAVGDFERKLSPISLGQQ
uniref:Uncharacterized protein n=1 Tax=Oryza sativa subsp. japonica TaxID=39947 RepID=Q2QXQ9_ORYSJ|nr:hypothetical protein LOC_Os12g05190 [Oryza sativa Japonica Group]